MSIVGIFSRNQPSIGGFVFDAILEESTELETFVTEFPVETGALGNDHAVQTPLRLSFRVGISDNAFRALRAEASDAVPPGLRAFSPAAGTIGANLTGAAVGATIGAVGGGLPQALGVAGSVANAAFQAGRAESRSQNALDVIRTFQRANTILTVVGSKREYDGCLITATRQETTKENENALELVVELTQLLVARRPSEAEPIPAGGGDPAETQASALSDLGLLGEF